MSSKSEVADRLLTDARKRTAQLESPLLAKAAMVIGIVAVLLSWISIIGWVLGATAIGMGVPGTKRSTAKQQAKIAVLLGLVALVVATFFFTLNIASRR